MCYLLDLSDRESMYECLSGCVFVQGVHVYEHVFTDEGILMSKNPQIIIFINYNI